MVRQEDERRRVGASTMIQITAQMRVLVAIEPADFRELIPVDRTLDKRLMTAGYIAGLWGKPKRWDPG